MGAKAKAKVKSRTTKNPKRVVSISNNRLAKSVVTIGYSVPKLESAKKLKGKKEDWKLRLGGKGAGLASMTKLGAPVPPAFNLSTELCQTYLMRQSLPAQVIKNAQLALEGMGKSLSRKFGSTEQPLLVSVRSGAPVSMPGMMDTILNLGLTWEITESLARSRPEQARFWWDCYRRLITMFSDVVLNISRDLFEDKLEDKKDQEEVETDAELSAAALQELCKEYLALVKSEGKEFPEDPMSQLLQSIEAVFRSWNTERAIHYRKLNNIPDDMGTSVTVQAMVFGNWNEHSGTGVVFTRDPSTGSKSLYGEFLLNAQGEDVVAGIRTPKPISSLKDEMPSVYRQLIKVLKTLEDRLNDIQDVEFTIQDEELFILQTRSAKRTASAAVEHAVQFVKEKRLSKKQALERMDYKQVDQLLHPSLKPTDQSVIGKGLPASPGAVSGRIALDPEMAIQLSRSGEDVILVRRETSPEDIMGMSAAGGILTSTGGMTSHAAVVGRGMGKACVVGCTELTVKDSSRSIELGGVQIKEGNFITINGATGEVYEGALPTEAVSWNQTAKKFFGWSDEFAKLKVLTNADTPEQAELARELGAQGIGLCRTEHMFFEADRLRGFRKMILSGGSEERQKYIDELMSFQVEDFKGLLKSMNKLSICVRLLDPPLHEFLPSQNDQAEIESLAKDFGIATSDLVDRMTQLEELNPMLGHRGCRLGITHPEIYEMQIKALAQAMIESVKAKEKTKLKIMIPLVADSAELELLLEPLQKVYDEELSEEDARITKEVRKRTMWGTMIELPRACLVADRIAKQVEFISFGTNDLTQTSLGLSRDDSNKFLPLYMDKKIYAEDPFQSLDRTGVGELIQICLKKARKVNPKIEVGVCGEHGGDPSSIEFFHSQKFDTVSCSPFRVPVARLACGRTNLKK